MAMRIGSFSGGSGGVSSVIAGGCLPLIVSCLPGSRAILKLSFRGRRRKDRRPPAWHANSFVAAVRCCSLVRVVRRSDRRGRFVLVLVLESPASQGSGSVTGESHAVSRTPETHPSRYPPARTDRAGSVVGRPAPP